MFVPHFMISAMNHVPVPSCDTGCRILLRRLAFPALLLCSIPLHAQTTLLHTDRTSDTHIAPAYFGPNAFPVPEMLDDAVSR